MTAKKMMGFVALCATFISGYAQLKVSLDLGDAITSSAVATFGENSAQAKLAAAYGRFIPDAQLSTDGSGNVTLNASSGFVQSATISIAEANAITGTVGLNQGVVMSGGTTQTITSTTLAGSKIEYSVSVGPDGRYQVTYNILVKITAINLQILTNSISKSFPMTPDYIKTVVPLTPPTTNPPPTTSMGGTSGAGYYISYAGSITGATGPTSYFWQYYMGPDSEFFRVRTYSVDLGPLTFIGVVP